MASALTQAHIEGQARLRRIITQTVGHQWQGLGSWDEPDVPRFLELAVPVVLSGQRTSVALTEAFLARSLGRRPLGVDPRGLVGAAIRNGTPPEEVYRRPFVQLWSALGAGTQFPDALSGALARVESTAAMDVQLSMRATADAVQQADEGIVAWERVADGGACAFCQEVDGAVLKSADAMPLHNNCGCGIEPLTSARRPSSVPPTVAVHDHGELGPVLNRPIARLHDAARLLTGAERRPN